MTKAIAIRKATALDELAGGQKVLCGEAADLAHNRYHRAARSSAAMAIVYAAMAGRELIEQRKKIKHGGWDKWVDKNCEFNRVTAWRYMEVAGQIGDKIQMFNTLNISNGVDNPETHAALIKLLQRPPSELLPEETELLLADIRKATEGQTLRQLYFDFGLVTPPKPTGGANMLHAWLRKVYPNHAEYIETKFDKLPEDVKAAWKKYLRERECEGVPEGMTPEHFDANTWWTNILREIHLETTNTKRFLNLDLEELKNVSMSLLDAKRVIDETIKKG